MVKCVLRVAREAERRPFLLIFAANHAWSYPVRSGTENKLGSLLFSPSQTERLGSSRGTGGLSYKSPSPSASKTKQKQAFFNATSFEDDSSLAELCHPSPGQHSHLAEREPPARASGSTEPTRSDSRTRSQAASQAFTRRRPARGMYRSVGPSPRCQGLAGGLACGRVAGETQAGKAAVQQAAARFLGTVTKARDCGDEDPQDRGWSCLQLPGDSVCASQAPFRHHEPRTGQRAPNATGHTDLPWHLSNSPIPAMIHLGPLWAARKLGLPRTKPRRQQATSPHTPVKQKRPRPGRPVLEVGSENLHIRKTITHQPPSFPPSGSSQRFSETQQGQGPEPLSWTPGCWESFGVIFHILQPQPKKCATAVNPGQARAPTSLP